MTYEPKHSPDTRTAIAPRISSVATLTTLKAVTAKQRDHGQVKFVESNGSRWYFHSTSELTGDDQLVVEPTSGTGRWLLCPGTVKLSLPITFSTADAAVLLTVPTGALMLLRKFYWTISADFTGGSSSAIGVSSTKTGFTTKGDLLGGATGDVAAALTLALSPADGTIGAKMDTVGELHTTLWKAADIIRFDRITSAFTAGTGTVSVVVDLLENAGA